MINQRTLNTYIAWHSIKWLGIAFLIIASVIMLVDFVELSRTVGDQAGVTVGELVTMTILKAPSIIEQTLPFIVLFGMMAALFQMNKRSELIIMRAAGLSAWRYLAPALLVTFIVGLLGAFVFNPLASDMNARFKALSSNAALGQDTSAAIAGEREIWLREGSPESQTVIMAKSYVNGERVLEDVTFYIYNVTPLGQTEFARRFDADRARLLPNGFWQLENVIENSDYIGTEKHTALSLPTRLTLDDFARGTGQAEIPSFWKLGEAIESAKQAGFSTRGLIIALHKLFALPLMLVAMTIVAATASMRLVRLGGVLRLMAIGGALGFSVFFFNNMLTAFGENGTLPAIFSAWVVPIFVLFCGLGYLCLREDG